MTPAQLDHLRRIDAHLANLLATAEKRTPGEWRNTCFQVSAARDRIAHTGLGQLPPPRSVEAEHNAAFIAACAGNAEAGWKTLRDEVREFIEIYDAVPGMQWVHAEKRVASILTAFPNV